MPLGFFHVQKLFRSKDYDTSRHFFTIGTVVNLLFPTSKIYTTKNNSLKKV